MPHYGPKIQTKPKMPHFKAKLRLPKLIKRPKSTVHAPSGLTGMHGMRRPNLFKK